MGENAERVQEYLRKTLSEGLSERDWKTEFAVGSTPVDIAGRGDDLVLVELEWRRADPADNTAKLFRHASDSAEDTGEDTRVHVFQVFTRHYELSDGAVSSKRKNAEFVGETASRSLEDFEYTPLSLEISPPKRGGELLDGWRSEVDDVAERIAEVVRT